MRVQVCSPRSSRLLRLGFAAVMTGALGAALSAASHGVVDTSFSSDGKATVDYSFDDRGKAVVVQPDGKIVVAGTKDSGLPDFAVARFNADGSLDATFSADGRATITFGGDDFAQAVALQTDGRIVVAGYTDSGGGVGANDFAVARFNADGSPDTSFSTDGKVYIDFGFDDRATAVAIQDDGRIVVVGYTADGNEDFAIARLTTSGSLDLTFDTDGLQRFTFGAVEQANAVAIDALGRIVVAGATSAGTVDMAVARLSSAGALDATFGTGGKTTIDFEGTDRATGVAIQADGNIVVAGYGASLFAIGCVARLGPNGSSLDLSFSGDGKTTVSIGGAFEFVPRGVVLLHNGKIAIGGHASVLGGANFAAVVLDRSGSMDTTFDADGRVTLSFGDNDEAWGIAVQPDGALVLAGFTDLNAAGANTNNFAIARIGADTAVDVSFDTDGRQAGDYGATATARAVLVDPDGRTVVAGSSTLGTSDLGVARFTTGGALDPTFDLDGRTRITFGGDDIGRAMVRQPDGKLVVVGYTDRTAAGAAGDDNFAVARLNSDGSLDTTFNDIASPTASNGDGRLVIDLNGDDEAQAVALQPDGKIVVAGSEDASGNANFAIVRLNTNGTLDTSFSTDGRTFVTFGSHDYATAVAIQADGKIVVAGYSDAGGANDFAVIRLTSSGALDTTFNDVASPTASLGDGRQLISSGGDDRARAIALQADGGIVVAGQWDFGLPEFGVVRLTTAGVLDPSFGVGGKSYLSFGMGITGTDVATGLVLQPDGKPLVVGYSDAGSGLGASDFAIARLNANGSQDTGFANAGELLVDFGEDDTAHAIALDPATGQIVVAGYTTVDKQFAVVRLASSVTGPAPTLPTLSINDVTVREWPGGMFAATFTVTLSAPSSVPVMVQASTSDGTGVAGTDYVATTTGALFLPGVTSTTLAIPYYGDMIDEPDVTFTVSLSDAVGALVADGTGIGTIQDDDVTVMIIDPSLSDAFDATRVLVTLSGIVMNAGGVASVRWTNGADSGVGEMIGTNDWRVVVPVRPGANLVSVGVYDPNGYFGVDSVTINANAFVSYLAEGATSSFLDTRLAFLNPGGTDTTATVTFSPVGAAVVAHAVPVPAHTRVTLDPKTVPGLAVAEFSTKVESSQPLVVDRTMSWDASGYGAHAETAVAKPSMTWYLAEGATHSGFDLFYLLQNPAATPTTVRVRYLRPSGDPLEKDYVLPPTSRTNIWVNTEDFPGLGLALASTDVSAVITSRDATPIIVERALYLTSQGRLFNAGHESAGVTARATQWFLAEGSTGPYFDLFVLIANPSNLAADVRLTYLLTDGRTFTRTLTAPPNSRSNVWVDTETFDGGATYPLADVAVSTTVASENGVGIIVERALWWPGDFATWHEAHNSAGATATGTVWASAEGEAAAAGDARGDETYLLIANTSAFAGEARVTLYLEDGTDATLTYPLAANSRTNVAVGPDFGAFVRGKRFGAVVESTGVTPAQIVVERAMYWNAGGVSWAAGTNALATRLR